MYRPPLVQSVHSPPLPINNSFYASFRGPLRVDKMWCSHRRIGVSTLKEFPFFLLYSFKQSISFLIQSSSFSFSKKKSSGLEKARSCVRYRDVTLISKIYISYGITKRYFCGKNCFDCVTFEDRIHLVAPLVQIMLTSPMQHLTMERKATGFPMQMWDVPPLFSISINPTRFLVHFFGTMYRCTSYVPTYSTIDENNILIISHHFRRSKPSRCTDRLWILAVLPSEPSSPILPEINRKK